MATFLPESDSEDELPPGWEERATIGGDVYYANHDQATTQWTHPRTGKKKRVSEKLPYGWERQVLADNKVVYVDHANKRTTFTDPRLAFAVEKKSTQDSFRQRYDGSSTALQVLHGQDLSGQVAVVTGGSSGIGFETVKALCFHGCDVVIASRDETKASKVMASILAARPAARCRHLHLDLASLASVKQFCRRLLILYRRLDYLVLGAGVFGLPDQRTEDGFESIMQVNYLGHFYLVQLLLRDLLLNSPQPRLVAISSESHRFSLIDSDSLSDACFAPLLPSSSPPVLQYNDSKLFLLLLAQQLHNRYSHLGVRCMGVHPGNLVYSGLKDSWWLYRVLFTLTRPFTKSPQQAAASVVFALCSADLQEVGGGFTYINNCFPTRPGEQVLGGDLGTKLWNLSTQVLERKLGPSFAVID